MPDTERGEPIKAVVHTVQAFECQNGHRYATYNEARDCSRVHHSGSYKINGEFWHADDCHCRTEKGR